MNQPSTAEPTIQDLFDLTGRGALVTGGAGFIGAVVVRLLLSKGYEVVVLDNLSTGSTKTLDGLDVELINGNILDDASTQKAVTGTAHVVHLAAQTGVPNSIDDPLTDYRANVAGTVQVLDACRRNGVRRLVFASSNAVMTRPLTFLTTF